MPFPVQSLSLSLHLYPDHIPGYSSDELEPAEKEYPADLEFFNLNLVVFFLCIDGLNFLPVRRDLFIQCIEALVEFFRQLRLGHFNVFDLRVVLTELGFQAVDVDLKLLQIDGDAGKIRMLNMSVPGVTSQDLDMLLLSFSRPLISKFRRVMLPLRLISETPVVKMRQSSAVNSFQEGRLPFPESQPPLPPSSPLTQIILLVECRVNSTTYMANRPKSVVIERQFLRRSRWCVWTEIRPFRTEQACPAGAGWNQRRR